MLSMEGKPEEWERILAFLEQTLRTALEYGFTENELERVKKELLAELDVAVCKKEHPREQDPGQAVDPYV